MSVMHFSNLLFPFCVPHNIYNVGKNAFYIGFIAADILIISIEIYISDIT